MIEFNEEQRRELLGPEPLAIDPRTQELYVLVRKEVYDRIKALLLDDSAFATADLVDQVMAEDDRNDPYLAEYQRLYPRDQP